MSLEEKQGQRVFLRERFLRLLTSVWSVPTEFTLHNQVNVRGKFTAADIDVLNFLVEDLETPMGTHPATLLRTTDIISMKMKLPKRITDGAEDDSIEGSSEEPKEDSPERTDPCESQIDSKKDSALEEDAAADMANNT